MIINPLSHPLMAKNNKQFYWFKFQWRNVTKKDTHTFGTIQTINEIENDIYITFIIKRLTMIYTK